MQRRTDLLINLANVLRGTSFEPKDTALVAQTRAAEFKQILSATPWSNEVNVAKICLAYNQVHEPLSTMLQRLDKQPQVKNMELIKETLTQLNWCEKKIKELAINYAAVCKKYNKQEMLLPNAGLKSVKVNL